MKLHGTPLSNYFNMVKHALLAKGLAFEEIITRPSQEPDFLAKSPMGKVPMLETAQGCLTETDAILDWLEEACDGARLFPADAFARAKVRQLMKTQELYVEGPAHDLIGALFNRDLPSYIRETSQDKARRGLAAIGRLARFEPWICGADFTYADIFVFHSFTLSNRLTKLVYEWDMLKEVPGLDAWYARVEALDITQGILAESRAASEAAAARSRSRS